MQEEEANVISSSNNEILSLPAKEKEEEKEKEKSGSNPSSLKVKQICLIDWID